MSGSRQRDGEEGPDRPRCLSSRGSASARSSFESCGGLPELGARFRGRAGVASNIPALARFRLKPRKHVLRDVPLRLPS